MELKKSLSYYLQNAVGNSLNDNPVLIIESDDWGMERIRDKEKFNALRAVGIRVDKDPYSQHDFLETDEVMERLLTFLTSFKDFSGEYLKITANTVMANPDFELIRKDNFMKWHYIPFSDNYAKKKNARNVLSLMKDGNSQNIFISQFHGREHLHVDSWLEALRSHDKETLFAFKQNSYAHPSSYFTTGKMNFQTAFHVRNHQELEFSRMAIQDGVKIFKESFGRRPTSFIAPRYIWPERIEKTLIDEGIEIIQGKIVRLEPAGSHNEFLKSHYRFQLTKAKYGGLNSVRNVFFEPAQNQQYPWVKNAMKRIRIAFKLKKPAVISMHRLNFVNGIDPENCKGNLEQLAVLIQAVQKEFPDVLFSSSDKLGRF
jgi:hypothetical protein